MTTSAGGGMRKRPEPLAVRKLPYKLESDRPDCERNGRRVAKQPAGPTATRTPNLHRAKIAHRDCGWRGGGAGQKSYASHNRNHLTPTGLLMEGVYTHRALFKISRSTLAKPSPTDR